MIFPPIYGKPTHWLLSRRYAIGSTVFYEFIRNNKLHTKHFFLLKNSVPFEKFFGVNANSPFFRNQFKSVCPLVTWDNTSFQNKLFLRIFDHQIGATLFFTNEALLAELSKFDPFLIHKEWVEFKDFSFIKHDDSCDLKIMYEEFLKKQKGVYFNHFKRILL